MKLGEKIKLVRIHRGLTQRELGERLHLDGNAANRIAQYESGFRTPKESRTKDIAKALNVREENYRSRVSGMDAAVTLEQKKTIKFFCIVDFPLSKQGIFFVTLRHKTVITMLSQSFVVSDSNCEI